MTDLIALLGRRDVPTDGVEDYCRNLGAAMEAKGCKVEIVRVPWEERGWIRACLHLWQESGRWKGKQVLVQYTALMWSRRGFPLLFLGVLLTLKARGVRLITVFHDFTPYAGTRWVDRIRRACQRWVLRRAYAWTQACVLPVPTEQVSWLPRPANGKVAFIPVGPNIPSLSVLDRTGRDGNEPKTIAVFVVTDGGDISAEVSAIAHAAMVATTYVGDVQLVTLGRGSRESESQFRRAMKDTAVKFSALGILSPQEVSTVLSTSNVSLFVRGPISTQRTTAIGSIANGVPLVAYASASLPTPFAEAGVVAVPCGDREALAGAVAKILTDDTFCHELQERSRQAYQKYFSWDAVAGQMTEFVNRG